MTLSSSSLLNFSVFLHRLRKGNLIRNLIRDLACRKLGLALWAFFLAESLPQEFWLPWQLSHSFIQALLSYQQPLPHHPKQKSNHSWVMNSVALVWYCSNNSHLHSVLRVLQRKWNSTVCPVYIFLFFWFLTLLCHIILGIFLTYGICFWFYYFNQIRESLFLIWKVSSERWQNMPPQNMTVGVQDMTLKICLFWYIDYSALKALEKTANARKNFLNSFICLKEDSPKGTSL